MKPNTVILARLVSSLAIAFPAIIHATVTVVGVDSTAGADWRTAAALEADGQYGTLGYVVFGLNAGNNVYAQPYYLDGGTSNAGVSNSGNLVSLPADIAITCQDNNIGMWSGNGNFGMMQDPANGNALTPVPLLANSGGPRQFTITRATNTGYRVTIMTASGDGANHTYSPSLDDGSGAAASTSYHHTTDGLAYHVFDITPGTSNIVISVMDPQNWSLTGIAFDEYVAPLVSLAWVGATSAWDMTTAGNWIDVAGNSPAIFSDSVPVLFDDTATATTVDISSGNVMPQTATFSNSSKDYTLQGSNGIVGGTALIKTGTGNLTVLNTNTYSGGTTLTGGTLQLGDGTSGHDGAVTGSISNNGSVVWNLFDNQTVSGAIRGAGSLDKSGQGTLTLASASSSYSGDITISGGTLLAGGSTGGSNPTVGSLGDPTLPRTITVNSGATLSFGANDVMGNHTSTPAVALVVNSGGTVTTNGEYFNALAAVTLNGGTLTAIGGANGTFPSFALKGLVTAAEGMTSTISASGTFAGYHLGDYSVTGTTFQVGDAGILNVSGALNDGLAGGLQASFLTKTGNGNMILTGANGYTGNTAVISGTLELADGSLVSPSRTDVNNGATYLVSGGTKTGGLIDVNAGGTYTQTAGEVTCTSQFVIGAHGTSTGSISGGKLTINAPFYIGGYGEGSGTGTFTQTGGEVVVNGGVNYNGGGSNNGIYTLSGGSLTTNAFGTDGGTGTATFNFNGGVLLPTVSTPGFMQGLYAVNVMAAGATINTNNYDITIGQALVHDSALDTTPDGGLTKVGAGTLTLAGTSTYTGNTTVNGGNLLVNGSITGSGEVNLAAGTALGGTGTIAGAVNVQPGGTLTVAGASGTTMGTLTIHGDLTLAGDTLLRLNKDGAPSCDQIAESGGWLAFGGTLTLSSVGTPLAAGDSFTIFTAGGTGSFSSISPATPGNGLLWDTGKLASDGILSVKSTGGYDLWAAANVGGGTPTDDFDHDGVPNAVEYFMGETGASFTATPAPVNGMITWPKNKDANAACKVQTSGDLSHWTDAPSDANSPPAAGFYHESDTSVNYTLPAGDAKIFFRLEVTIP